MKWPSANRCGSEGRVIRVIGEASKASFKLLNTRSIPLSTPFPVHFMHCGRVLHSFNITVEMSQNPFTIAKTFVDLLYEWYVDQFCKNSHLSMGSEFGRRYRILTQLALQLRTLQEVRDMHSFHALSQSLDSLDQFPKHLLGPNCLCFNDGYITRNLCPLSVSGS